MGKEDEEDEEEHHEVDAEEEEGVVLLPQEPIRSVLVLMELEPTRKHLSAMTKIQDGTDMIET